jgi:hypothetical protein
VDFPILPVPFAHHFGPEYPLGSQVVHAFIQILVRWSYSLFFLPFPRAATCPRLCPNGKGTNVYSHSFRFVPRNECHPSRIPNPQSKNQQSRIPWVATVRALFVFFRYAYRIACWWYVNN